MPIIGGNTASGSINVPGSYVSEPAPTPITPLGPNTSLVAIAGTGSYGVPNTPIPAVDAATAIAAVGNNTALPHSIIDAIVNGALPLASSFLLNRVTDGTDTAASAPLTDATGFALASIAFTGTAGTGQTATVTFVSGGNTVTVGPFTLATGASNAAVATQIATAIANSTAVNGPSAFLQSPTPSTNTIPLAASASGTPGNAITVAVAVTGSGITATPTSATAMTGGAAPGTLGHFVNVSSGSYANNTASTSSGAQAAYATPAGSTSPLVNVTLFMPGQNPVTYQNIVAYAAVGGGFDAPTFIANLQAAVNVGTSKLPRSAFWVFVPGTSTAAPLMNTLMPATGGTDGAAGVTSSILFGQPGVTGRTGVNAFQGKIKGGILIIAGFSDCTFATQIAAFCQQNACISAIALGPAGTTPAQAIAASQNNAVASRFIMQVLGEPFYTDAFSGVNQLESPLGSVAGTIANLNPWEPTLNKPEGGGLGMTATEFTIGQFPDEGTLQDANIAYFKKKGGKFVLWQDRMSDGTPCADVRMLNFLAVQIEEIGDKYVGKNQSTAGLTSTPATPLSDATRAAYVNDINNLLTPMANPNNPQISPILPGQPKPFNVSLSANTATTTQQGFLLSSTSVLLNSGIRYVLNVLQVGSTIQVQQAA
jgi:hypothetical protein